MKRLNAISKFIYPYRRIADVGSDHGYLIKIAFDNNLIDFAYAIDNKQGPINACKKTLSDYNNVKYFLSDGLTSIDETVECVIIAGMGGLLIKEIIEKGFNKLNTVKRLILQANKDEYKLRKYLCENGFYIKDEAIIEEDNKINEKDVFEKGKEEYSFEELYFGKVLMKKKDPIFIKKWKNKYKKYQKYKNHKTDIEDLKIIKGMEKILCK